jgi:hypothetical protein
LLTPIKKKIDDSMYAAMPTANLHLKGYWTSGNASALDSGKPRQTIL